MKKTEHTKGQPDNNIITSQFKIEFHQLALAEYLGLQTDGAKDSEKAVGSRSSADRVDES
jgi:hypothetical protein